MKKKIYAGTYTGTGSEGIYCFDFEDGRFSEAELFCKIANPKSITMNEGRITGIGTHDELLASNTEYREIAESQLGKKGA